MSNFANIAADGQPALSINFGDLSAIRINDSGVQFGFSNKQRISFDTQTMGMLAPDYLDRIVGALGFELPQIPSDQIDDRSETTFINPQNFLYLTVAVQYDGLYAYTLGLSGFDTLISKDASPADVTKFLAQIGTALGKNLERVEADFASAYTPVVPADPIFTAFDPGKISYVRTTPFHLEIMFKDPRPLHLEMDLPSNSDYGNFIKRGNPALSFDEICDLIYAEKPQDDLAAYNSLAETIAATAGNRLIAFEDVESAFYADPQDIALITRDKNLANTSVSVIFNGNAGRASSHVNVKFADEAAIEKFTSKLAKHSPG